MYRLMYAFIGGRWQRIHAIRDKGNPNVKVLISAGGRSWWGPVPRAKVVRMAQDGYFHRLAS
jgi:hypothetical protein